MNFTLTDEQTTIVNTIMKVPQIPHIQISAVAGSSKSTTLEIAIHKLLERNADTKIKLLYFGKTNSDEAKARLPKQVDVSTVHGMARAYTVGAENSKLHQGKLKPYISASDVPKGTVDANLLEEATKLAEQYTLSSYLTVAEFVSSEELDYSEEIIQAARLVLGVLKNGGMPVTHAFYLKLFHSGVMDGSIKIKPVDVLIIDEAQDLTQIMIDVIGKYQTSQRIYSGDSCLIGSTKVLTSNGWKCIKSIVSTLEKGGEIFVKSYNKTSDTFEFKKACNPQRTGIRPVFKVKGTKTTIVGTANHKVLTTTGYKRIDQLEKHDLLTKYKNKATNGYAKPINKEQYQILLGSFLGDGHISKTSPTLDSNIFRLALGHSEPQKNYLMWKLNCFNANLTLDDCHYRPPGTGKIRGKSCSYKAHYCRTTHSFGLKQEITLESVQNMTELGLAIWLMDDGSIKAKHTVRGPTGITLSTAAFSLEENKFLQQVLFNNFGLESRLGKDREYYEINFSGENTTKLLNLVAPFIHNDFTGKFKLQETTEYELSYANPNYIVDSVVSVTKEATDQHTFDIEVADNHNFVVSGSGNKPENTGVVVHNCQAILGFAGAIDVLSLNKGRGTELSLTKSFRINTSDAQVVQHFMRTELDEDFIFEGFDKPYPAEPTFAYLTRTNAALIDKMVELDRTGTPYKLSNKTKLSQMFNLPLTLATLKPNGEQINSDMQYLQDTADYYYRTPELASRYTSLFSYLRFNYKDNPSIIQALDLVAKHGAKVLFGIYKSAKIHMKSEANLIISTQHTSKGLTFTEVELDPSCDKALTKVLELHPDDRDSDDLAELYLAYISFSRHTHKLSGSTIFDQLKQQL